MQRILGVKDRCRKMIAKLGNHVKKKLRNGSTGDTGKMDADI